MLKDFSKETFDVIIQGGQSNSEGYGRGAADAPFTQDGRILYLTNDSVGSLISVAAERVSGNDILADPSLAFAARYVADGWLREGGKLLIVRAAVSGTGFFDNRWKLRDDLFLRMIEMTRTALDLNPDNRLAAFIWHQGETDALGGVSKDTHFNNLKTLVETVRNTFDCESLPFIAGDFVQHWARENVAICAPVVEAMRDVCAKIGNSRFVETEGLTSNDQQTGNGDIIHFSRNALNLMGERYYSAFCDIVSGGK